jgi:hypothetical protein
MARTRQRQLPVGIRRRDLRRPRAARRIDDAYEQTIDLEELARRLACAFISYQMHTTYETARRNYGGKAPGEFWFDMARHAIAHIQQMGRR